MFTYQESRLIRSKKKMIFKEFIDGWIGEKMQKPHRQLVYGLNILRDNRVKIAFNTRCYEIMETEVLHVTYAFPIIHGKRKKAIDYLD